ncbi:MAG TPA: hypothetical protein P5328_02665 [Candidatus Paceibacterota bacterium]|nr:hypothetical protein [Candidatus Paceibacterota bacterium]HRZ34344.1 hypothetical protein [Candidatus Paceibacterota bacterium]
MPNIEIHGFRDGGQIAAEIRALISARIPEVKDDFVTTVVPSKVTNWSVISRPFIRVASTNKKDLARVARRINLELGLDVEWLLLGAFFEGKTGSWRR